MRGGRLREVGAKGGATVFPSLTQMNANIRWPDENISVNTASTVI